MRGEIVAMGIGRILVLVVASGIAAMPGQATSQEHQHDPEITPFAKELNESFGDADGRTHPRHLGSYGVPQQQGDSRRGALSEAA